MAPLLRLLGIRKAYGGVTALDGVDLAIGPGEIVCLAGENGSGKSTLIKVLAGVERPDAGEVSIGGRSRRRLRPIDAIRGGIAVIYQDLSLFPSLSVAENVALGAEVARGRRRVDWRWVRETARTALERTGARLDLDAPVGSIPIASRQLVAIARALAGEARLLVMDEPTAALARREVRALFSVIEGLRESGISTLFVSHKLDEVLEVSRRTVILRSGRVVADAATGGLDRDRLALLMTGRSPAAHAPRRRVPAGGPPVLEVEGLSVPGILDGVSFHLRAGEIVGLTGLLGSGRTELALALFGLAPAAAGRISVDGRPVRIRRIDDALRRGIAYVPEDRVRDGLFLGQSIGRNIIAAALDLLAGRWGVLDRRAADGTVRDWLGRLAIRAPGPAAPAGTLSGGNGQRVLLARWLARSPRILILDLPTAGVDVGSKEGLHEVLRERAGAGVAVLLISDDVPELLAACDRILILRGGRIAERLDAAGLGEEALAARLAEA